MKNIYVRGPRGWDYYTRNKGNFQISLEIVNSLIAPGSLVGKIWKRNKNTSYEKKANIWAEIKK